MLKFNDNNIFVGYISQLLKDFNLPSCKVWKPGMQLFKGCHYATFDKILTAKKDYAKGVVNEVSDRYFNYYDSLYKWNKPLLNITNNFSISTNIYDTHIHEYLGNYLRYYRDIKNIDLMSMYNCFSNTVANNLKINRSIKIIDSAGKLIRIDNKFEFDTNNDFYKIYVVPVKYYTDYTIAIDCDTKIEIVAGFYNNGQWITNINGVSLDEMDAYGTSFYDRTYIKRAGCKYSRPFLYSKLKDCSINSDLYNHESILKLFIKVPATSKSAITILEGDYTHGYCFKRNDADVNGVKWSNTNNSYLVPSREIVNFELTKIKPTHHYSIPQLLYINSQISYPIADRLMEYLVGNVITPDDEIGNNIKKVRRIYSDKDERFSSIYDYKLREHIYNIEYNSNIFSRINCSKFDLIGYVDKDTETLLGLGDIN